MLVWTAALRAQGVRYDNIVLGPRGLPAAAASIAVCSFPANSTNLPCSPLASIYANQALTQPVANPFQADSLGNYGFWALPGHYVVQIYGAGTITKVMDVFLPCDPTNCTASSATISTLSVGTLNLTGALTINGRNVATEAAASDAVYFVSPNGNDTNDGLSWGSAFQTLYHAVSTMESSAVGGGTLYAAANAACGGPVTGQGLWLVGPGDAAGYASPPSGWIKFGFPMRIIGVGVTASTSQNSPAPAAAVNCGSAGANPPLWISGVTWSGLLEIDHLAFSSSANNALRLGISTTGSRTGSSANDIVFDGDSFSVNNSGSVGPAIDIGASVFWIRFLHTGIAANSGATGLSDAHQGVVINPTSSGSASGLIWFEHTVINGGGIHFYGNAQNGGSLYVDDLATENGNDGSPAVWITTTAGNGPSGGYVINEVAVADATVNPTDAVKTDGGILDPGVTLVSGVSGHGQDTSGPMTLLGADEVNAPNTTISPLLAGQQGAWAGAVWAPVINDGPFNFPVQNAPWPNLVSWSPNIASAAGINWTNGTGGTLSQTTAPDGTSNGWKTPASSVGGVTFYQNSVTVTAGDYFIAAGWSRSFNGGYSNTAPFNLSTNACGSPSWLPASANTAGFFGSRYKGTGWQYSYSVMKIGVTSASCQINFSLSAGPSNQMAVFAPALIHIPAGSVDDGGAVDLAADLGSFPSFATPGVTSTLPGHPLAFGGSGDNYFATLDHTALTVNQTYTLPNQSGVIGLVLSGTAAGSTVSLPANSCGDAVTATVSGAATSMVAVASPESAPSTGLTWHAFVSGTNTVTIDYCNVTTGSITPASVTWAVRVIQ